MGEHGATLAAFAESMGDPIEEDREEPTVVGPEKRVLPLRLVKEQELRGETSQEQLFVAAGTSLRKQQFTREGRWIDAAGPNEDGYEIDKKMGLVAVYDGFGGHEDGAKAVAAAQKGMRTAMRRELEEPFILSSELQKRETEAEPELQQARLFVENTLRLDPSRFADEKDVERALRQGIVHANEAVVKEAPKGGTTVSAAVIYETFDGARHAKIVNRGDSRVYLYRNGVLRQLTKDDSYVQELVDRKVLVDDEDVAHPLNAVALQYLKGARGEVYSRGTTLREIRNAVTAGLSRAETDVEKTPIIDVELKEADLLIEVTDGETDNSTRKKTAAIIRANERGNPQDIATELAKESQAIAHSDDPRAKEDDMTSTVTRIEAGRSLKAILEQRLDDWKQTLQTKDDPDELEKGKVKDLYQIRNQLEFAIEGHPGNEKLVALRDHVFARLQLLDSRVRELRSAAPSWKVPDITKVG